MTGRTFVILAFGLLAGVLVFGAVGALMGGQHWQNEKQFLVISLPICGFLVGWGLFEVGRK